MMICKADFEDLFPHLFKPEAAPAARQKPTTPGASYIARGENDGARSKLAARSGRAISGRRSQLGSDLPDIARTGAMAATIPAAAAYAAAWTMLSGYDR